MVTKARLLHDTVIIPSGSVATTQSASDNSTKVATTAYVTTAIANLADSAPSTLNTLNELAAALGDDANFSTTVTNSLATKATIASPSFTGNATFDTDSNSKFLISDGGADAITLYGGTGDELYIGADNAYKLRFRTNGNIVMDNGGSFGIGTAGPASELDVAGVAPTLTISNTQDKSWTSSDTTLGELAFRTRDTSGIGAHNVSFIRAVNEVSSSTTPSSGLSFGISQANNNASEAMRIDSFGQVGIGTSNPGALLHLNGTGDAIRVTSTNSGAGGAQLDLLHYTSSPADEDINGMINFGGYYSGSTSAYATAIRSVWSDVSAKEGRLEFWTRDDSTFAHHMQINHHGGIAMGPNNQGYAGQILSIKAGTGNNVIYGESDDANCIVSLRDNSSTANIGFGATGNAHTFSQDGTEVARISTGSADKYSYSGAGLGGNGTNLVLAGDDSEIKMANNFIHSDNSGLTQMTIRCGYGVASTGAELSLDAGRITFNTGSSFTEKMRIDSNGYLMYNTQSASSLVTFQGITTNDIITVLTGSSGNSNVGAIVFRDGSADYCGQITCNGSTNSVSYISSSDYRLKENVVDMTNATTRLKQLQPKRFNWISDDTNTLVDGFLAHEVSDIVPEAVVGEKDAVDEDDNPKYQGIDYGKLVPLLVKTIQELEARIATLEG